MMYLCIGVDPGLVHTGIVGLGFDEGLHQVHTWSEVVDGLDAEAVADVTNGWPDAPVVIEAYRPRSHYQADARMGAGINEMKRLIKRATTLDNTGVKKIVTPELMKLLDVWSFPTTTHHQDLRSAARIALYAMLKDDNMNHLLSAFLYDEFIAGQPWFRI